jgi:hypothetical protein
MLVIRHLSEEDVGNYRCVIRRPDVGMSKWPVKTGSLTVLGRSYVRYMYNQAVVSICVGKPNQKKKERKKRKSTILYMKL